MIKEKKVFIAVLWILLIVCLLTFILSFFKVIAIDHKAIGYCEMEKRKLSDDEMINKAVEEILYKYPPKILFSEEKFKKTVSGFYKPAFPVYYKNVDDFKAKNTNCCSINHRPGDKGYQGRVLGNFYLTIKYKVNYTDTDGNNHSVLNNDFVFLNSCGSKI